MRNYTQEERQKAIELYISSGFSPTAVKRKLGYPCKSTLLIWYRDYLQRGYVRGSCIWPPKFTEEQKRIAVEYYLLTGKNLSQTVRDIGYPSRALLGRWVDELAPGARTTDAPRKGATSTKCKKALYELATLPAAEHLAYIRNLGSAALYNRGDKPLCKKEQNMADDTDIEKLQAKIETLQKSVEELKAQAEYHKMEVAIWKAAGELLKKDPKHRSETSAQQEKDDSGRCPENGVSTK